MVSDSATLRYCIDTSFLINGWRKHWRPDVFPSLWNKFDNIFDGRTVFSCRAVLNELRHQRDELLEWALERRHIFQQPTGDHTLEMQQIMHALSNFAAAGGSSNEADPWVVSHAIIGKAIVVTDEIPDNTKPTKPPKLPTACEFLGVKWMSSLDFLHAVGISI